MQTFLQRCQTFPTAPAQKRLHRCYIFAPVPNFPHRCKKDRLHRCYIFALLPNYRTGAKKPSALVLLSPPVEASAPEEKMVGFYWCFIYGASFGEYAPVPVSIGAPLPVLELSYKPVLKSFPRELPLHQFHQCIYLSRAYQGPN